MDYKIIIKSKRIRLFVLRLFSWVPGKIMIKLQYRIKLHRDLNLKNPRRFTEKIQHYKLFYRNIEMISCVDKYKVREYLKKKDCVRYLNELYFVYDNVDEIEFTRLPNQFVLKTTDGGGGDNIFICKDKSNLDSELLKNQIKKWKNKKIYKLTHEWAYVGAISSKIIVEKYLEDENNIDKAINDYKLFCFNGVFRMLVVDVDRYSYHKRNFYDRSLNLLNVTSDCPMTEKRNLIPSNINEMILLAETISKDFPFVRVDLYNIKNQIIFGEMTFYPWSGYVHFDPDSFDFEIGDMFDIDYK